MYDLEAIKSTVVNYGKSDSYSGYNKGDFQIGDRVVCVGLQDHLFAIIGKSGTVVTFSETGIPGVEFDDYVTGLYCLSIKVMSTQNGFYVRPSRLVPEPIDDKEIKIGFDSLFED